MKHNLLISLSGIDGSGKSTQIKLLQEYYSKHHHKFIYLWTRGGYTPYFNLLKSLIRKLSGKKLPNSGISSKREEYFSIQWVQKAWLRFAILDLLWIYTFRIRIWMAQNKFVICDRYIWDTMIDFKIMFPTQDFEKWFLWKMLVLFSPKPKLEFLLTIPLKFSDERCKQKFEPFPDTPERRKRRYKLYQEAEKLSYWKVIDSTRPLEKVFEDILRSLK